MSIRLDIRLVPRALLLLLGLAVVAWIAYKGSQDSRGAGIYTSGTAPATIARVILNNQ